MYDSKEDLIEMSELSPPGHHKKAGPPKKPRRRNKIHSPPVVSPRDSPSRSFDKDLTDVETMFSIKKAVRGAFEENEYVETLSEISDGESQSVEIQKYEETVGKSLEKSSENLSKSETTSQTYRDKIRQRFNAVREQAARSVKNRSVATPKLTKEFVKLAVERVKREADEIDASVKMVRTKFNLTESSDGRREQFAFFNFSETSGLDIENEPNKQHGDEICQYKMAENLNFNLKLSEKEWYFIPNRLPIDIQKKITEDDPRYLEDEGLYVDPIREICQKDLSILEQRLLSVDDKKWFNCQGQLEILSNPVINRCLRPDINVSVGDCVVFAPPKLENGLEEVVTVKENILELSFSSLKFMHHPLFSAEHVLERKLKECFEKYSKSVESNSLQKLRNQLEALRHTKGLKKASSKDSIIKDIKKIREDIFKCGKSERTNLKLALEYWKCLKKLRQQQNYSNTTVKLTIKREKANGASERETQKKFFGDLLQDVLEEYRNDFKKKLKDYHKKLQDKEEEIASVNSDDESEDSLVPEKPVYDVDEKAVEFELKKKFEESFKPPGEPILTLHLTEENEPTQNVENEKESIRRKTVETTKIFLRLYCNKVFICKSKSVQMNEAFLIEFNEAFSIQLVNVPRFITVEVVEQPKSLLKKKICQLEIELSSQNVSHSNAKQLALDFDKEEIVNFNKHSGVGSGIKLKKLLEENDVILDSDFGSSKELYTQGCLCCRVGWQKSGDITDSDRNDPTAKVMDFNFFDKCAAINQENLTGWIEGRRLDPQDPKNFILYEYLEVTKNGGQGVSESGVNKYFRLSPFSNTLRFCDPMELNRNIRLQYLKLRDQNEIEFDGMVIPSRAKEIPLGPLKDFRKRKALEDFKEEELDLEGLENRRLVGKRHLQQIHTKIFQKCKRSENNLDYDSVVDERLVNYFEQVIKTSLQNVMNWFKWTPAVNLPLPKIYKPEPQAKIKSNHTTLIKPVQSKIEIKILSAKNIPIRKETLSSIRKEKDKTKKRSKYLKDDDQESNKENEDVQVTKAKKKGGKSDKDKNQSDIIRPFLEVKYENFFAKTSVGHGNSPSWNEVVILPLEYHQTDYLNPNSLTGHISIRLFDSLVNTNDNHDEDIEHTERCHWLGEVNIPVSALTSGQPLKGWFKVKMPELLLNYDISFSNEQAAKTNTANLQHQQTNHRHTQNCYLELEININPNIPQLQPDMEDLPSNDSPYINDHVISWNRKFNDTFPDKRFSAFAIDTSGKTNCITRYIRPLEPPQLKSEDFDVTADQCARYVSLIPFTESNRFYHNVWLRTEELLTFMIGSPIDHAVTLTCFLLALKMDAWLLLGFGIPQGPTAYALVREYSREAGTPKYYIYDVVYNEKWELDDPYCPLQKVFCLVNGQNVWANTQKTANPSFLRFDLTRRFDWWPLFDSGTSAPTNFVNTSITYSMVRNNEDLERKIERKLKKRFSKLRPLNRTVWQHRVSEVLKNSLRHLETGQIFGKSTTEVFLEIAKGTSQYSITGLALNIPFTDVSATVREMKKLNIHVQPSHITDFLLSVFVAGYKGEVLSVWLFLGTVEPSD